MPRVLGVALAAVVGVAGFGCQLITGTYSVGGDAGGGGGDECFDLANCCGALPAIEQVACNGTVELNDAAMCATELFEFATYCGTIGTSDGGLVLPDTGSHHHPDVTVFNPDVFVPDVFISPPLDACVTCPPPVDACTSSSCTSPADAGSPVGFWELIGLECADVTVNTPEVSVTIDPNDVEETIDYTDSDGDSCDATFTFEGSSIGDGTITLPDAAGSCDCEEATSCFQQGGTLPYTLSDDSGIETLVVTDPSESDALCQLLGYSGPGTYTFTNSGP